MNIEKPWESQKEIKNSLRKEISDAVYSKEEEEKLASLETKEPYFLQKIEDMLFDNSKELQEDIYLWYKNAMQRRDREPLEKERFIRYFFNVDNMNDKFSFGSPEKGFLLGYNKYGVFIPTHFAPKTIRGGYELIKELGKNETVPSVMAITLDLSDTISKMSEWHVLDMNFLSSFREEKVDKNIAYNSHPDVTNLMWGLVNEYMEESDYRVYKDEDYDSNEIREVA